MPSGRPPLGPVWSFPSAGRRLARHLAARPNHPSTSSTREIRPHTDAPRQTPPGRPTGDDAKLQTGPSPPAPTAVASPGCGRPRCG
ncbi:hypothetical protein CP966_13100 [Streptomyces galilaeus]|nr:hypothetical protein CP966_13100 [Streptomyces galilaeus]